MLNKRKVVFGRKRKFAEQKAVKYYMDYFGDTEEEAKDRLKGKRVKKNKARKPSKRQNMK